MQCSRRYPDDFITLHTTAQGVMFCVIDPNINAISSATNLPDLLCPINILRRKDKIICHKFAIISRGERTKTPNKMYNLTAWSFLRRIFAHAEHLHAFIGLSNENYLLCLQFGTSFEAEDIFAIVLSNMSAPAPPHFGILLDLTPITLSA